MEAFVEPPSERKFGLTFAVVAMLIAVWGFFHFHIGLVVEVSLSMALFFLISATLVPQILKVPNRLWFRFGLVLHRITNPIILGLLFFGAIYPMGLVLRTLRGPFFATKPDSTAVSYWHHETKCFTDKERWKQQF